MKIRVLHKLNERVDGDPVMVLVCLFGGLALGGVLARAIVWVSSLMN